jgi:PAS domain S-box-containing protein
MKRKLSDSRTKKQIIGHTGKTSQNDEAKKSYVHVSKFLELLIRSLPGVFYALDENFRMYIWNENVEKITGYGADEIRELGAFDFFDEENRIIIQNSIEEVFREGKGETEAIGITKDGRKIPYFFTGASAIIEEKRYTLGIGMDISSLKEAQESLIESEALYRTFAERMTEGVALIRKNKIVFANNNFASILGFPDTTEIIGQNRFLNPLKRVCPRSVFFRPAG